MDKLDILLQKNPLDISASQGLENNTFEVIKQVKKARLARRMLAALFVLAIILFVTKWFNNDVFYFIEIALHNFTMVVHQSSLYWSAFFESLPKGLILVVLLAGGLWFGWKRFETFFVHDRTIHTMIPRFILLNAIIVTTLLGFAGYSYAQKTEQQKLELLREHINQTDRKEFSTNLPAQQCNTEYKDNLTKQYEIKKSANLNINDAKKVLEAACNQAQAQKFLIQTFHLGNPDEGSMGVEGSNDTSTATWMVSQVTEKTNNSLVLKPPDAAGISNTFTINANTKVYKDTQIVPLNALKEGDIVLPIVITQYANMQGGDPLSRTILGLTILPLDPEFKWYQLELQHSVTQIQTCKGNPQDRCSSTGSIDFFPSGEGEGNTKNLSYKQSENGEIKEISGVLTEISGKQVKIKTSSGHILTIIFGSDPVGDFNRDRAKYYGNDKVTIGDTLLVTYDEPSNRHATTIHTEQIVNAVVMVEIIDKTKPLNQY